jgi:hypothetical protein
MNKYERAAQVRERGLLGNITDSLASGGGSITGGIGRGISETFKAKALGNKEKFDPLNIARKMSGGFGVGLLGRMMGRSSEDMSYFANKGKRGGLVGRAFSGMSPSGRLGNINTALYANVSEGSRNGMKKNDGLADVGAKLYNAIKISYDVKKLERELDKNFSKEHAAEDQRRHEELIREIEKSKKKTPEPKKIKVEIEKQAKKAETPKEKTPAAAPAPVKTPTVGKVEPKPTAKRAEAPAAKPTAKPAEAPAPAPAPAKPPAPAAAKPPVSSPVPATGKASKVLVAVGATTAVLAGKEAIAANISRYESGKVGYNAYNKGTIGNKMIGSDVPIDFSKMTISEFLERGKLKAGDPNRLFAIGKYQIIPKTMEGLVEKLKLDPDKTYLDADTQDKLFANGLVGIVRKKVDAYVKGVSDDRDAAILELSKEFASVGVPYDINVNGKLLKRGESYYSGKGGNKAHNSPDEVGKALDIDRSKNLKSIAPTDTSSAVGSKLNDSSVRYTDAKKQTKGNITVINDNTTTAIIPPAGKPVTITTPTTQDRPAYQK